ncbi:MULTISPECIES: PD-(D/E)XK nuclease family protein [unclassified Streptomyces]|uniref:PD-(D/E)XK nuclease family protein n=1 Tax=unclassified Streptomyces TaxID=2593676 RepID=UPI00210D8BA4|nr:PD-(D/E)XK nuclease family protein [Streptomyces sp. ScaeMP-e83]
MSGIITVSLSMLKGHLYRCSAADALKARGYRPLRSASQGGEALEHFALGPFMTALGRESPARSADEEGGLSRVPLHDGLRQWTAHAVKMYREAFTPDPAESLLRAVTPWVYRHRLPAPDHRDAREYRITAWGRCLRTADGSRRELRLPVNRLGTVEPHVGYVAAAALVLAEGTPGPSPEHVRVVEFALLDGSVRTLFDGTRAEAVELYRIHGSKALTALLDSREYRPGSACGGCAYLSVCPALRKEPGLLGVTAPGRPRRTWSVTNGRNYRACPARDHMRRLSLPAADEVERDSSAERGRAIHAYLAERHGHGSLRSCTVDVPFDWAPDGFHLSDEERELATLLLRRHASVCPLRYVRDRSGIRAEPRVVRHDPTANTVVIAAPDLLYRDEDSWVWRETKTSKSGYRKGGELLDLYPQLALAVPLIARGALGGSSTRARIELEILRPGGADLEIIDPFCPAVVSAAEKALSALVSEWHQDDHYLATPGRSCGRCEVARWCSARLTLPSPPDGSMA